MTESINNAPLGDAPQGGSTAQTNVFEERAVNAARRYREGYIHARAVDALGTTIEVAAFLVGCLLVLAGISLIKENHDGIIGIAILLAGFLVGGLGYILGVIVKSAGQALKAQLDCAVNGSPFLNDAQRAKVMSLE